MRSVHDLWTPSSHMEEPPEPVMKLGTGKVHFIRQLIVPEIRDA